MRSFDFSPLYRSAIGFDRVANLLDSLATAERNQPNYPPYNIELTGEDHYRITMAVAGFTQEELSIEVEQNNLVICGKKPTEQEGKQYLYQGIAERSFERRFQLADHVRVEKANFENGLLHINLVRELPEVMKPRSIEIQTGSLPEQGKSETVEHKSETKARDAA